MSEEPELTKEEQETRKLNLIKSRAKSASNAPSEEETDEIVQILNDGHGDSWQVALSTLETIVEENPECLDPIIPKLIKNHTTVRTSSFDEKELREENDMQGWYSTISSESGIGIPLRVTWVLDDLADNHPEQLLTHKNVIVERYENDTLGYYPDHFRLVIGKIAAVDSEDMPIDTIRSDLEHLSKRDDFYGDEAREIINML